MIAFVSGVLATLLLPQLPPLFFIFTLSVATLLAALGVRVPGFRALGFRALGFRNGGTLRWLAAVLWLIAGIAWGLLHGHWRMASVIPAWAEQQDVTLSGFVTSLPQCKTRWGQLQCRFELDVITAALPDGRRLGLRRVQLTRYLKTTAALSGAAPAANAAAQAVDAGACLVLLVRLKRPHGLFNPGGADIEAARLRENIGATGYVRTQFDASCGDALSALRFAPQRAVAVARALVRQRVIDNTGNVAMRGLLLALVLGDYSLLDGSMWDLFNATGTQHLVTVSGLHIGIAAMLGYWLGNLLALPWRGGLRRLQIASACAFVTALGYALLAGWSTPTVRSLLMLSVFLLARLLRRDTSVGAALRLAFAVIVVVDPLAATSVGFWLSFGAVAVLVLGLDGRRRRSTFVSSWLAPQWVVFVGLAPLLLACFGQLPPVSMLANLLAVPWTSFVVMPGVLICALGGFGWPLLNDLLAATLEYLCLWLMWCRSLGVDVIALPAAASIAAIVAMTLAMTLLALAVLLPRGLGLRLPALALLVALLLADIETTPTAGFALEVFDVGQGLAVLVRNGRQHLLFDTGAAWGDDVDVAQIAVLPYLRARGIVALQTLMISHADMDHAGGVRSVRDSVAIGSIVAGEALPSARDAKPCVAGQHWQWQEATLSVLWPRQPFDAAAAGKSTVTSKRTVTGNNASCVLLVEFRGRRLLITGDIEALAERALLADAALVQRLAGGIDVLIAPHHGSRTSSTPALVAWLRPRHVVFATGYRNRYRHPHPDVVQRYRQVGSTLYHSDQDGFVRFEVDAAGELQVTRWRQRFRRYWFGDGS